MTREAIATYRAGQALLHIYTEAALDQVLKRVELQGTSEKPTGDSELLQVARAAAREAHAAIVAGLPSLYGQATTCFATALRAQPVRARLEGATLRGLPLAKWSGWLASADDAARHLNAACIKETVSAIASAVKGPVDGEGDCGAAVADDPLAGHDPWAGKLLRKPTVHVRFAGDEWASWRPPASSQWSARSSSRSWERRVEPRAAAWPAFDASLAVSIRAGGAAPGQWAADPLQR